MVVLCALGGASAWAAPASAVLEEAWQADIAALHASGVGGNLAAADFVVLAKGNPVVHHVDTPEGSFAVAAIWIPTALPMAWIAVQDARDRPLSNGVVQEWLPGGVLGGARQIYMRLDLPWPVADRQWVSDLGPDAALFAKTEGRVWRFSWTLADPALAPNPLADAVWVEENRGSWTLLGVEGGTLCVLSVRSLVGGSIPAAVSQSFARSTLQRTLRTLAEFGPGTAAHYRAPHPVLHTPDSGVVPLTP